MSRRGRSSDLTAKENLVAPSDKTLADSSNKRKSLLQLANKNNKKQLNLINDLNTAKENLNEIVSSIQPSCSSVNTSVNTPASGSRSTITITRPSDKQSTGSSSIPAHQTTPIISSGSAFSGSSEIASISSTSTQGKNAVLVKMIKDMKNGTY